MISMPPGDLTMALENADLLVVGCGFFGTTIAERASHHGLKVVVLDSRSHIGGNAFSYKDSASGIEVHKYGSHLFHTSNPKVWEYVNRFTTFNSYQHHVWTQYRGVTYPMPIGLATMAAFFRRAFTPEEAKRLVSSQSSELNSEPQNFEEKAISLVGRPLYEAFIRGYTAKQWQIDPRELPMEIITRLPVRYTYDTRYFTDKWEGLPLEGYTSWIENMLASREISVFLKVDYFEVKDAVPSNLTVVYTGPIDRYFGYSSGQLTWRTLDFEVSTREIDDFQGAAVMNSADEEVPFTRVHEFKHLHPERNHTRNMTVTAHEFSRMASTTDEPYYPVNTSGDRAALKQYRERAKSEENIFFGGRLGSYQYLDMHMAIASALTLWENQLKNHIHRRKLPSSQ